MTLKLNKISKKDLIYKCSKCGNLRAIMKKEKAPPCQICQEKGTKHHWIETNKEVLIISKNVKTLIKKRMTKADKVSELITDFCGSITFVYIHLGWFFCWIVYNLASPNPFDPFPFGLLTLAVSLEAIILATFILIAQNQQSEISEMRSELDYQTDIKSEKNTAEILALLKRINNLIQKNNKK